MGMNGGERKAESASQNIVRGRLQWQASPYPNPEGHRLRAGRCGEGGGDRSAEKRRTDRKSVYEVAQSKAPPTKAQSNDNLNPKKGLFFREIEQTSQDELDFQCNVEESTLKLCFSKYVPHHQHHLGTC